MWINILSSKKIHEQLAASDFVIDRTYTTRINSMEKESIYNPLKRETHMCAMEN